MKRYLVLVILLGIVLVGCVPATKEPITKVDLKPQNKIFQKVYNHIDKRELDSLLFYTSDFDPANRYLVAHGLASIQDKSGLDSLYKLLDDPVMKVRQAAAFAIGQVGGNGAANRLLTSFKTKDTLDVDNPFNATILESIGKIGQSNLLVSLATVSSYRLTDSLLLMGQARGIYNYSLRGIIAPEGTDRMVQFITEEGYNDDVRLMGAHYLSRVRDIDIESFKFRLAETFQKEENTDIKLALARALRHTTDKDVFEILKSEFSSENNVSVKVNILRALYEYPYIQVVENMLALLGDDDKEISTTAARYLVEKGNRNDAPIYKNYVNDSLHYEVNAALYSSVLKHIPAYYTNTKYLLKKDISERIENSKDVYERAAYIQAFGHDPLSFEDFKNLSEIVKSPIEKSALATSVSTLMTSEDFIKTHRGASFRVRKEIVEWIKGQLENADAGEMAIYGELLADESLKLKDILEDSEFLKQAMKKCSLPKEIESFNNLKRAYAVLNGIEFVPEKLDYKNTINWDIFNTYGDSAVAALKTNKGVIKVKLFSELAPGSVANFLSLAKDDFYSGKVFHRVVPNFVIQGGCPRGDGYGALDYTIRSELAQLYYEEGGYIGMARTSELDTEGTQFFITHSPTPHLSGEYTIFGKVINGGMDVVDKIEVGDKIEDIIITK